MSQGLRVWAWSLALAALIAASTASAQTASARGAAMATTLVPTYQDDYDDGDWRQQVRVASPVRHARWDAAPQGSVRVYHRRFDTRWSWRSAPRHHVVYTYYRGDLWFLDPTTGWAYSVDRYGIVYTADPYRGWVYSLGPLTRWTADLLYFFDLYQFDRGYWYCFDYDYFVDLWEGYPRHDYYTYDTAYSTLWGWEPYFGSVTFITYSNRFSNGWVGRVRSHRDYIGRNPHYRRELIDAIGLPAVQAVPPRLVSPRAVATSAYWEARDLAGAGLAAPRGRDLGQGYRDDAAGTIVDARQRPARVVEAGTPAPGFNAPFPDGSYGMGVKPGGESSQPPSGPGGRGSDPAPVAPEPGQRKPDGDPPVGIPESLPPATDNRGRARDDGTPVVKPEYGSEPIKPRQLDSNAPPQFGDPAATPQPQKPDPASYPQADDGAGSGRGPNAPREAAEESRFQEYVPPQRDEPRFQEPNRDGSGYESSPREEPRYEEPVREEPNYEPPPREEPRYEEPVREEPKYEPPPREEPRYEEPVREEPQYEPPPREEPRYEEPVREEPKYEPPPREEPREEPAPRDEPKEERQDERA